MLPSCGDLVGAGLCPPAVADLVGSTGGAEPRPYRMYPSGFPYEGKLSAVRLTDEVDSAA